MTLDEINSQMQAWMQRDDVDASQFTMLVEADANRRLRVADMVCPCTTPLLSGTAVYALPSDWAGARTISTAKNTLKSLTAEQYLELTRSDLQSSSEGTPEYYAIVDHALAVYPTPVYELAEGETIPEDAPKLQIIYYKRIPPLSDTNGTNWLSEKHYDVYLYGCLNYGAQFVYDDARAQKYADMYERALGSVHGDDWQNRWSGDAGVIRLWQP